MNTDPSAGILETEMILQRHLGMSQTLSDHDSVLSEALLMRYDNTCAIHHTASVLEQFGEHISE